MAGRSSYATKSDLFAVRDELKDLKADLGAVRDELKADVNAVRDELKADVNAVRDELKAVRCELKDDIRGVGVMVERLDSKIVALSEGLSAVAMKSELHTLHEAHGSRISLLEDVVRDRAPVIAKLETEVAALRKRSARK